MRSRNLLVAAVLLAALSGAVWWAKRHPESAAAPNTPAAPKVADIADNSVQQIEVQKKGGSPLTLDRRNGKWTITSPESFPADQEAVGTVVSSLSPVTADSVVEDKPSDLSKFGLTSPSLTVSVKEKNGKTDQLFFGDDVPAGSLVYVRSGASPRVYSVSSSVKSSFDKSVNDLRDKRLLTFNSNQVTRVDLTSGKSSIEFGKNNQNDWQILKPKPYRADSFQVEELLRKLGDAKMDLSASSAESTKADSSFSAGQSIATAEVTDAGGTQTLQLHKAGDTYYAQSSILTGAYKVSADLGKELEKPLDDFRTKKIFDFGFSDPNKIEIQQGDTGKTYQKSGQDWKINGTTMNPSSVQAFIDKLRDLSATNFAEKGFTTPALTITVTSNDGKRIEKAEFAKVGEGYIARRENEPAQYQVDSKAVNDIVEAIESIKPAGTPPKK